MSMTAFHSELHSYGTFLLLLIVQAIHLPHMCGQLRITDLINMDFSGQWEEVKVLIGKTGKICTIHLERPDPTTRFKPGTFML